MEMMEVLQFLTELIVVAVAIWHWSNAAFQQLSQVPVPVTLKMHMYHAVSNQRIVWD